MKKPLFVVGAILLAAIAAVAITGFIRFNFTNGGDVLGDQTPATSGVISAS